MESKSKNDNREVKRRHPYLRNYKLLSVAGVRVRDKSEGERASPVDDRSC